MDMVLTTVGDLVVEIYQEVLSVYGNEAMAAVVTAYVVDQLMSGPAVGGSAGN